MVSKGFITRLFGNMKLTLFGYGGHAREVQAQLNKEVTFYVDDEFVNDQTKSIRLFNNKLESIMVAISNSNDRQTVVNSLPSDTHFFSFIHPTSQFIKDGIQIGEGSFIGANCILTTNILIGSHAILNRGNHIGHDCQIGNYFSMMPGSIISGNVNIEDNVYIGTNATVIEKINICSNVVIGAGAVVTKDIEKAGTYIGVPAKYKHN